MVRLGHVFLLKFVADKRKRYRQHRAAGPRGPAPCRGSLSRWTKTGPRARCTAILTTHQARLSSLQVAAGRLVYADRAVEEEVHEAHHVSLLRFFKGTKKHPIHPHNYHHFGAPQRGSRAGGGVPPHVTMAGSPASVKAVEQNKLATADVEPTPE